MFTNTGSCFITHLRVLCFISGLNTRLCILYFISGLNTHLSVLCFISGLILFQTQNLDILSLLPGSSLQLKDSERIVHANAPVATVLGSIPASVGTVESEGRQMKQC